MGYAVRALFMLAWLGGLLFGLGRIWRYESTPGPPAQAISAWPAGSRIPRTPGHASLILFAHPHCPCTRATLNEFARLLAGSRIPLTACVLFSSPVGAPPDWDRTPLVRQADSIPGVSIVMDRGETEARRLGAVTSGHAMLFDPEGRRLFSGGITLGRGHEGENGGSSSLSRLLSGGSPGQKDSPVYGCAL
jgi:hypothetical protein